MKTKLIAASIAALLSASALSATTSVSISDSAKDAFVAISGQGSFTSVLELTPSVSNGLQITFSALDGAYSAVTYTFYSDASLTNAMGLATGYLLQTTSLSTNFSAGGSSLLPFSDAAKSSFNLLAATPYYLKLSGTLNDSDAVGALKLSVRSAVVSAVPEPESYAMLLAGLGLMVTIARRRNRATEA